MGFCENVMSARRFYFSNFQRTANCEETTVTGAATSKRKLPSPISSRDNVTAGDKKLADSEETFYRRAMRIPMRTQPQIVKIM